MVNENLVSFVLDAQQGNEDAFAKLYSRTLKNSYYLCLKLTADADLAREVLKKGYAAAFCSIGKLKRPEAFESWLKQKMAAAYKSTRNFYFGDADADAQASSQEFLPASVLDDDSLCRRVEDYVAYLPDEQRTVAVLYYCVGMPVEFIAKFLNVSPSTVESLLAAARQGIVEPLNLGDVTLSEDTMPVLTKIFMRSAADTKIENDLVRQTFIYAIDCYHGNENPLDEITVSPETESPKPAAESEREEAAEGPADGPVEDTVLPEDGIETETEPETIEIDENTKPSQAVTGADLLNEINRSINEIAGSPLLNKEQEEEFGGIYISQISEEDDKPAQEDIPVREKPEKKPFAGIKDKKKFFIIAAIALVLLAAIIAIAAAVRNKGGKENEVIAVPQNVSKEWVEDATLTNYKAIQYFNENYCIFQAGEEAKWGLMDYQGNVRLQPTYYLFKRCSYGRDYNEDEGEPYHYLVQNQADGKQFILNMDTLMPDSKPHENHNSSSETIEKSRIYDERDRFHNGYAAVRDEKTGKWGYISEESRKLVIDCNYEPVNVFENEAEYAMCDYCLAVDEGLVAVKRNGKMGIINLNGETIVDFEYAQILQGKDGVFIAQKGSKWGYILVGDKAITFMKDKLAKAAETTTNPDSGTAIGDLQAILSEYDALDKTYETNTEVNVRDSIGTDGSVITELEEGKQVKAVAEGRDENGSRWICVELDSGYGWLRASFVDLVYD
ncbi:MAG: sigma-70 family RNA polymerase sigma factor [Clostridia bacterium]|nr:sigma-70 family RNA polymerase sigma factor [Clostridia bacterium]